MRRASLFFFLFSAACGAMAQNALPNLRPPHAPRPTEQYWQGQWNLDNRNAEGIRLGPDLNVRGAWQRTKGEGVVVAVVDDGVDLAHPDLAPNAAPGLHFNFDLNIPDGRHQKASEYHGTATAGVLAAALDGVGVAGVAPAARFASWHIFPANPTAGRTFLSEEKMAAMFQHESNRVAIQVHNWIEVAPGFQLIPQGALESAAISNAVALGRNGRGVVMVRGAGNGHFDPPSQQWHGLGANDNAYTSDPRVIAVAASRADGRVASYSQRGACVLVSALSGDLEDGFPTIWTTDRVGSAGINAAVFPDEPERANYRYFSIGFTGTSAASPMIGGICALMLSANPTLGHRDVQQILIHASRHVDRADPDLRRNGAGYWVSHRQGFGIPDAAEAVRLAEAWSNRPPMQRFVIPSSLDGQIAIPDAALRVAARAPDAVPPIDESYVAFPSLGLHPDDPTMELGLVDVGLANAPIQVSLNGKGALIERGGERFITKINHAAAAGAAFAVVHNNTNVPPLSQMTFTDFARIPAVFISKADGEKLKDLVDRHSFLAVQLRTAPAIAHFQVAAELVCEHVGVRIRTSHPSRQDLRISLVSPGGTRSVLQAFNQDTTPGPRDWTFYSTQHFYESPLGEWTLEVVDEIEGSVGSLLGAELILHGTPIQDSDRDGLDDRWEQMWFAGLAQDGLGDPDGDGSWNAREHALVTDPTRRQTPFSLSVSLLQANAIRIAFPGAEAMPFTVLGTPRLGGPLVEIGASVGDFNETEIILTNQGAHGFIQVRRP